MQLNVFLLACCVDVGVVEQESDWFGGDQAATALFQQIVKQIHSFPDKVRQFPTSSVSYFHLH